MDKLEAGDSIEVRSKDGSTIRYTVYKKATYNVADVPLQELFNKSDGKYLNLITCVGSWNASTSSYDKRMIVFAKTD
jgi:sortase (surface protein transpeptidase)